MLVADQKKNSKKKKHDLLPADYSFSESEFFFDNLLFFLDMSNSKLGLSGEILGETHGLYEEWES